MSAAEQKHQSLESELKDHIAAYCGMLTGRWDVARLSEHSMRRRDIKLVQEYFGCSNYPVISALVGWDGAPDASGSPDFYPHFEFSTDAVTTTYLLRETDSGDYWVQRGHTFTDKFLQTARYNGDPDSRAPDIRTWQSFVTAHGLDEASRAEVAALTEMFAKLF